MITFRKLRSLIFLCFLTCAYSIWATDIYYIPSDYDGSAGQLGTEITGNANFEPLCNGRNSQARLPGLDLVRQFSGEEDCRGRTGDEFEVPVDAVLLIDDTSNLSSYLLRELESKNLLQTYSGRQVVSSQIVAFTDDDDEDTGSNILIVGEMDYRQFDSSESAWFAALSGEAGNSFCEISAERQRIINDFATQTHQMNEAITQTMQNALNNFDTRMGFESVYSAEPQIGRALADEAIKQAQKFIVGKISSQVPGFNYLVGFADAANAENRRAIVAGRSQNMGQWITDTRTFISNCLGNSRCTAGTDNIEQITEILYREEIEGAFCRLAANRKEEGINSISSALSNSLVADRGHIKMFEKSFYEAWINSNFPENDSSFRNDSVQGTIEVIWVIREQDGDLRFDGDSHINRVNVAEYGDEADDGMNDIISALSSVSNPWDFEVRKKVCFLVDNINIGGRSRECAFLDKDNSVIRRISGSTDMAERAFSSDIWRNRTTRFRR